MCGLILLTGANSRNRVHASLQRIKHRGPNEKSIWSEGGVTLGFVRLAINGDVIAGKQPYTLGKWTAAINGEIYNHVELARQFDLAVTDCDTNVVLPLFDKLGSSIIHELDGFFAGVFFNTQTYEVYCLRDHMGKKPLFVGLSDGDVFIASELKAFNSIDWFEALPKGCSKVNLKTGEISLLEVHSRKSTSEGIIELLANSVQKRMPKNDQPVGVFLSGGLDSSLIASFTSRLRKDLTYFILGDDNVPDFHAARKVIKALGLRDVRIVPLPEEKDIPELLNAVVWATESYNPSVISNGLATFLLARAAREAGIKVVITGEGADELFGGYHQFKSHESWKATRHQLINDMQFTELRRLDLTCMAQSVEARCPFLDAEIRSFSDALDFHQLYNSNTNKVMLRHSFDDFLPEEILHRQKTSCDVGSGIRGMVVKYLKRNGRSEREELLEIWQKFFGYNYLHPYFHQYSVFDQKIDQRGETHR